MHFNYSPSPKQELVSKWHDPTNALVNQELQVTWIHLLMTLWAHEWGGELSFRKDKSRPQDYTAVRGREAFNLKVTPA